MTKMRRQIVKESDLREQVNRINAELGFKPEDITKRYTIGTYILDSAYGGHRIVKVLSEGGCIETIPGISGFYTKRELYNKIRFFHP